MGTLAALAPLLGIPAGIIISQLSKSELKAGAKYFRFLQHALLAAILALAVLPSSLLSLIVGTLSFVAFWSFAFKHPLWIAPLLSLPAFYLPNTQIPIFLYFIPTGTLNHKETKKLLLVATAYFLITITASQIF